MTARPMEDERLLPCPLCGAPALLEHDSDHHGEWFNLGCSRHYEHVTDDPCPMGRLFYTESREDESAAIKKWNTRRLSAEVKGLREALEMFQAWWDETLPRALIDAGVTGVVPGPKTQAMLDAVKAALSPIQTQVDEQARPSASAPSSTLSKDTSK